MNYKKILFIGSIFGLLAVVLGAFGAHGLKALLLEENLIIYKTGVSYHFYHTFAILLVGIIAKSSPGSKWFSWSAICFMIGIVFFSGSIYLLSCREIIGLSNYQWLGPITPIGGFFFILGWLMLGVGSLKITEH